MTAKKIILLFLVSLCVSYAGTPPDTAFNSLFKGLQNRPYMSQWDFFPLACFPFLTAQHHPWTANCAGNYKYVQGCGNIACLQDDGFCYIGSKRYKASDSLYLYRAEKYQYTNKDWVFVEDYVVVTDKYSKVIDVLVRYTTDGPFKKVDRYVVPQ